MSDEVKVINEPEKNECKCFCQSKGFRKFLTIALGTFVGVYAALSLFAAIHKPPMMPPCAMGYGFGNRAPVAAPCPMMKHRHHFDKFQNEDGKNFNRPVKHIDKGDKRPTPFEKDFNKD